MRVLPTKWRRKAAGIDMERNYVIVTLCIAAVDDRLWNFVFHVPNVTSDANEITSSRPTTIDAAAINRATVHSTLRP